MNNITLEDARGYLKINKFNLDEELVQQPILYETVSAKAVISQSRTDKAKKEREQLEYMLDKDIRSIALQTGRKITEKAIDAEIRTNEQWLSYQKAYEVMVEEVGLWSVLQEAYKQRAFMLRDLVMLSINEYNMSNSDAAYAGKKAKLTGAKVKK